MLNCVFIYSYFVDKVSSLDNNSTQFLISAPNQRSLLKRQEEWVKVGGLINITQSGLYDNIINLTTSGDGAEIDITQDD